MRPHLLVTLLLISILISHAQGIRLNKGFRSHEDRKTQKGVETRTMVTKDALNLKDDHISGHSIKLMAKATSINFSTTSTTSKNDGNNSNASPKTVGLEHHSTTTEKYPDTVDLAEMDYSPASRKPPIHN